MCPNKGLSTINIEKRTKIGKGLSFKGSATYEIGCWVDVPNRVVLIGTIEGPKSKITLHELSSKEWVKNKWFYEFSYIIFYLWINKRSNVRSAITLGERFACIRIKKKL